MLCTVTVSQALALDACIWGVGGACTKRRLWFGEGRNTAPGWRGAQCDRKQLPSRQGSGSAGRRGGPSPPGRGPGVPAAQAERGTGYRRCPPNCASTEPGAMLGCKRCLKVEEEC